MFADCFFKIKALFKSKPRLKTRLVQNRHEIRTFFDQVAEHYVEFHGKADRLLKYRLGIVRHLLQGVKRSALVEIGCGTGIHLFELTDEFDSLIGTDISPNMIREAEKKREYHPAKTRIRLFVDPAEKLSTLSDACVDTVLCIGTLEHIPRKSTVLSQVYRVLKSNGAFICLTPNGSYLWYTYLAPLLDYNTRHLSSDVFLNREELLNHINRAGLEEIDRGFWRFIPRGDMPNWIGHLLFVFDFVGQCLGISAFRGGLFVKAVKLYKT